MKPSVRICLIAVLLSAVLFVGGLAFHHSTVRACGQYSISGSTVTDQFVNPSPPTLSVTVSFSLWYDSCTGNNFTVAQTINSTLTNGFTMYAVVNRASGSDGGALSNLNQCPQPMPSIRIMYEWGCVLS